MKKDWLWDRNITQREIKNIFSRRDNPRFVELAALLLSRKNSAQEVFKDYIKSADLFISWYKIKRQMRRNSWNDPRIEYWQAIYDTLKKEPRFANLKKDAPQEKFSHICNEVGVKIRKAREGSGLTQGQLAKKLNVSQQVISRIESGRQNVSLETLEGISQRLGLSLQIGLIKPEP